VKLLAITLSFRAPRARAPDVAKLRSSIPPTIIYDLMAAESAARPMPDGKPAISTHEERKT